MRKDQGFFFGFFKEGFYYQKTYRNTRKQGHTPGENNLQQNWNNQKTKIWMDVHVVLFCYVAFGKLFVAKTILILCLNVNFLGLSLSCDNYSQNHAKTNLG